MTQPFPELHRFDPLIVAGIDPGTRDLGFGVVGRTGGRLVAVDHGVFRAPSAGDRAARLLSLEERLNALLDHHRPHVVALEEAFIRENVQSALRLGEARGMIMLAAARRRIPVVDYPTAVAKKSVTGHGGAEKSRVQSMVAHHLDLPEIPTPHDAADALALALCLLFDPRIDPRFAGA